VLEQGEVVKEEYQLDRKGMSRLNWYKIEEDHHLIAL
jgi:hypothetical protein